MKKYEKIILLLLTVLLFCAGCSGKTPVKSNAADAILHKYPSAELDASDSPLTVNGLAQSVAEFGQYYTDAVLCDHNFVLADYFFKAYTLFSNIYGDIPALSLDGQNRESITLGDIETAFGIPTFDGKRMKPFPENASDIDRGYAVHTPEIWNIICTFASQISENGENSASYAQIEAAAADLYAFFGKSTAKPEYIIRSFEQTPENISWFITQRSSGEYAQINCMPSITAMAILRATGQSITPDRLRVEIKPDGGWYLYDIRSALRKYGISFEDNQVSEENILTALDEGNMLLVKCSYADADKISHCMAIYGYKRCGDAVWLFCADPDKETVSEMPFYYAMYIIERCTSAFISVKMP